MIKHHQTIGPTLALLLLATGFCVAVDAPATSFYKHSSLFSTAPDEKVSLHSIDRVGPVGIGIELVQPAFAMKVKLMIKETAQAEPSGNKPSK